MGWIENEPDRVAAKHAELMQLEPGFTTRGRLTPRLSRHNDRVLWFIYGAFCVLMGLAVAAVVAMIWLT